MGHTRRYLSAFAAVAAVALLVTACGGGAEDDPLAADWAALEQQKAALDAKRQELADLTARAAAAVEEEVEDGAEEAVAEGEAAVEDLSAQIEALQAEVSAEAEAFASSLVNFLNADPMIEGEPITERQQAAIRMKSSEDMALAQEWIDEGGDYKRAIQIYDQALVLDPDNPELQAARAAAEEGRYVSEERFAAAKKGMTDAEIKATLGTPLHYNVRTYEDRGVTAWFYPTSESGSAAAVWFRPDDDGVLKVYQVKYDAVEGGGEEGEA